MSYVNRLTVAFHEVGEQVTLGQIKAFVLLRQSALASDDKRKIIAMTNGDLDAHKIDVAMRALSSRVLNEGSANAKKKVYPVNFMEDETHEPVDDAMLAMGMDDYVVDEDEAFQILLSEGDEQAQLVQDFEDQVVEVVQESPELAMAFPAYQDARARIRDRIRSRGFWPTKGSGKSKWSSSTSWSSSYAKGKGNAAFSKGAGKRSSLAERIASSHCRLCGQKGHWKRECPKRESQGSNEANLVFLEEATDDDDAFVMSVPPLHSLAAWCCTEDFVFAAWSFGSSKVSQKSTVDATCMLRDHLPHLRECLQLAFASSTESHVRAVSRHGCVGIIDTGASKSVIGQNRVKALVDSLPQSFRDRVARRPSETVFRFGNNGTLKSIEALFLPFGSRWMKVEVVSGSTPFLISNAFLHALEVHLNVAQGELTVPARSRSFSLTRNEKGLLTVNLLELIATADEKDRGSSLTNEVISFATGHDMSGDGVPHENEHVHHKTSVRHETSRQDQQCAAAAKVAQSSTSNCVTSTTSELSPDQDGRLSQDVLEQGGSRPGGDGREVSVVGCSPGRGGRSEHGGAQGQDRGGTTWTSSGHPLSSRVGRDGVSGWQACEEDIPLCFRERSPVYELHVQKHSLEDSLDKELSGLRSASDGTGTSPQLQCPQEATRVVSASQEAGRAEWRPSLHRSREAWIEY